jgi:hypothetical protein
MEVGGICMTSLSKLMFLADEQSSRREEASSQGWGDVLQGVGDDDRAFPDERAFVYVVLHDSMWDT